MISGIIKVNWIKYMSEAKQKIKHFLQTEISGLETVDINYDTEMYQSNILDSINYVRLVIFVEGLRDRPIPQEEFNINQFATINSIARNYLS